MCQGCLIWHKEAWRRRELTIRRRGLVVALSLRDSFAAAATLGPFYAGYLEKGPSNEFCALDLLACLWFAKSVVGAAFEAILLGKGLLAQGFASPIKIP